MCGENLLGIYGLNREEGSPPRVRGKLKKGAEELVGERITPACAGKTRMSRIKRSCIEDHPRVCGENRF